MEKLFQSVQIGDTDAFNRYIEKQFQSVNTPDLTGSYLIHYAVEGDFLDICRILIEKGASIDVCNRQDETPLHIAAKNNFVDICSYLIEKKAILDARILF